MRSALLVAACSALVAAAAATGSPDGGARYAFTPDPGVRLADTRGASELVRLPDGSYRLYAPASGQAVAYSSTDGLAFTRIGVASGLGTGSSIVRLTDGRWRAYFPLQNGNPSQQTIASAVSTDGLTWTREPGLRIADPGFGVPDALPLPDGRIRLFWTGADGLDSAVSADGLAFTREPSPLLPPLYAADPAAVALPGGGYLLAIVTRPDDPDGQRIFLASSTDGETFDLAATPVVTVPGGSATDPILVPLGDGSIRMYYNRLVGPALDPASVDLVSGVLRPEVAPPAFRLAVVVHGKGRVVGSAVACPGRCTVSVAAGATLRLRAVPARGWRLAGWRGACTGRRLCAPRVTHAERVVATFRRTG